MALVLITELTPDNVYGFGADHLCLPFTSNCTLVWEGTPNPLGQKRYLIDVDTSELDDPGVPANWSWTSGAIPALKGGLA